MELHPRYATVPMVVVRKKTRDKKTELIQPQSQRVPPGFEVTDTHYKAGSVYLQTDKGERRSFGSYYTPDDLVGLIIRETIEPLVKSRLDTFSAKAAEIEHTGLREDRKIGTLKRIDPAEKLLDLKICDPAMGSGHFLVSLVDYLADQVITAMAEAEATVGEMMETMKTVFGRYDGGPEW